MRRQGNILDRILDRGHERDAVAATRDLYKLSWFDAHLWAYADERGLDPIGSEDFEDDRLYGRVRVQKPFRESVHEPAALSQP